MAAAFFSAILISPGPAYGQTYRDNPSSYLLPGFGVFDEQWEEWKEAWSQYMADSEVPWIRTNGELRLVGGSYESNHELDEETYYEKQAAYDRVLDRANSDKLTLVLIASTCNGKTIKNRCQARGIFQKLTKSDPDNVQSYLVGISHADRIYSGSSDERAAHADSKDIREWILGASRAKSWSSYTDIVAEEWYRFNLEFVRQHPPPTAKQRDNPDHVLAFDLTTNGSPFYPFHKLDIIPILCGYYARQGEQKLIKACERLAEKFRKNHWAMGFSMQAYTLDHFSPESLYYRRKHRVFQLVSNCQDVTWKRDKSLWGSMESKPFEDFVSRQARYGAWQAKKLTAIDEFASFPSRYSLNPALCEDMLNLDSAAMGALLGDEDPLEAWLANQEHILARQAEEAEPFIALSYEELSSLVDGLDTVESVDDPVVRKIGHQGLATFPLLQNKLCSDSRLTALSATFAIQIIDEPSMLIPLLETLAEGRNNHVYCETTQAVNMVMDAQEEMLRELSPETISREMLALLSQTVCKDDQDIFERLSSATPDPEKIVIYSNTAEGALESDCAGYEVEIRNYSLRPKFKTNEFTLASFSFDLYTLPADLQPMPEFEALFAGRPEALARVSIGRGSRGDTLLWVKVNGTWLELSQLGSWIS